MSCEQDAPDIIRTKASGPAPMPDPMWQAFLADEVKFELEMRQRTGASRVALARRQVASHSGSDLLTNCVREVVKLVCDFRAFGGYGRILVDVSEEAFRLRVEGGPLDAWLGSCVNWRLHDDLITALAVGTRRIPFRLKREKHCGTLEEDQLRFYRNTFNLAEFASSLSESDGGFLGIKTADGVWCQAYDHGWMRTAPTLVPENKNDFSVVLIANPPPERAFEDGGDSGLLQWRVPEPTCSSGEVEVSRTRLVDELAAFCQATDATEECMRTVLDRAFSSN